MRLNAGAVYPTLPGLPGNIGWLLLSFGNARLITRQGETVSVPKK